MLLPLAHAATENAAGGTLGVLLPLARAATENAPRLSEQWHKLATRAP